MSMDILLALLVSRSHQQELYIAHPNPAWLQIVQRTHHAASAAVQHMGVDHRRRHVRMNVMLLNAMHIKRSISVRNHSYQVEVPDACPICHRHSEIQVVGADVIDDGKAVQAIFRCAYTGCRQHFSATTAP